jgi:iron complex outermembrane receptor protein
MTLKTTKLRDAITFALAVGATAAAGTGVALAQEATTESQQPTTLDRIEVTGSRIKRTDIETSQPIFSLSRDEISAQGLTSVGDVIQNITANGSTLNSTFNNGGNGETRVSLRNLGSNRTLVLVNGRRWIGGTGLGGAVDLNTIPTAAVERIEVLKDGASSIYGSDAIAGVVNVILRQNFDGAEANAYIGAFDKGDGERQAYDFTVGSSGERWAAMLGVGYVKEEPVHAGDREISAEPVFGTGTAFGSTTSPGGRFALCGGTFDPLTGTCSVPQTRPDGSGGQFTYDPGSTADDWRNFTFPGDVYNFAPDNYLLTPQERRSIFANGSLDITDNLRFKVTTTYNERISEQLLAAMPVVLGSGPGAGVQSRAVTISPDSIYNPFGQTVSRIQRRAVETGGRSFNQDVSTFAFNGGLEGTFDIADKPFDWEAGMFWGRNQSNNVTNGLFNVLALKNALGPSMLDGSGNPVCVTQAGNLATAIPGCVPLNLLGGVGSITPEMLAYSTFVAHDQFEYKQKTYYANIGGDLFEMPGDAGPFAFSFGLEHRTESGFDSPDALINSGNTTGNSRTATEGGYKVDEAYLELAIPVLKDLPFARLLDFSVATRYSDYSNFGDTLNSKFGFRWKPIEDLMVRGNWAEGFRAPSISELFAGLGDSFPTITDPCNLASFPNLSPDQQARCIAQGVPDGGYDQGNPQIRINVGGNPNLLPETSTSKTLGLVYSPSWLEGFDVSLDWWQIEMEDTITFTTGQAIVDGCVRDGRPELCALFTRNPGGALNLTAAPVNQGNLLVEGYDMTVGYRLSETPWGKFSFVWDTTYLAKSEGTAAPTSIGEYTQNNNGWRIRSNLAARWEMGDWGATWNVRYYDDQDEDCQAFVDYGYSFLCSDPQTNFDADGNDLNDLPAENHIGATTYHDVSAYWNAPWNAKITLGVNNLFDKNPPRSVQAFANSFDPQYEVPGQFYYMRYTQKF